MLVKRRRAARDSGGRLRGIVWAMLWNITSFTAAILLSGAVFTSVADLVTVYLWFLLLSFAGLLVLPTLNRKSVFALDRYLSANVNTDGLIFGVTRSRYCSTVLQPARPKLGNDDIQTKL